MSLKEKLIKLVGKDGFFDDSTVLESYSKDFSLVRSGMPNYAVKPKDAEEIILSMKGGKNVFRMKLKDEPEIIIYTKGKMSISAKFWSLITTESYDFYTNYRRFGQFGFI